MPATIRKDDRSKRIMLDIIGPPPTGVTDSFGNKKRFSKRKVKNGQKVQKNNIFEETGFNY